MAAAVVDLAARPVALAARAPAARVAVAALAAATAARRVRRGLVGLQASLQTARPGSNAMNSARCRCNVEYSTGDSRSWHFGRKNPTL